MRHVFSRSLCVLVLVCVMTVLLPNLSLRLVDDTKPLPAAYFISGDADIDAEKLSCLFKEDGLLRFDSEDLLYDQVQTGRLSMGVIVPGDLGTRLSVYDIEGVLTLVTAQPSALEVLQKTEIMSALYDVLAPYITCGSLCESGFGFERDAVLRSYDGMESSGRLFSFEQVSVEGASIESTVRIDVFRLVLGLMLWIGMPLGVCLPVCGRVRSMSSAIGKKRAWLHIGIPGLALGFVLLASAAALSCRISGFSQLTSSAVACLVLMGLAGLLICLLFPGNQICTLICIFLGAFAPALCPALVDISIFIPIIAKVRVICPVYWLWM